MVTKYMFLSDNTKLAYWYNKIENSKYTIVILHGLAEHKGRYFEFIHNLSTFGLSSFAIDLRGHGESEGTRGDVKDYKTYMRDLTEFLDYIKLFYKTGKLILFGHSLGGQIVLSYVNEANANEFNIIAAVVTSPAIIFKKRTKLIKLIPYHKCGFFKIKKRHSESKEMLEYSQNDSLACQRYSLRLLGIMFIDGVKLATRNLVNIKIPTIAYCGENDPLIDYNSVIKILNKFNSHIESKVFSNTKHRIVQNGNYKMHIQDIINWILNLDVAGRGDQ